MAGQGVSFFASLCYAAGSGVVDSLWFGVFVVIEG